MGGASDRELGVGQPPIAQNETLFILKGHAELRLHYSLEKVNDHDSPQKDYMDITRAGIDFRSFVNSFTRS